MYPEIRLAPPRSAKHHIRTELQRLQPLHIHIATAGEGTLGRAAVRECHARELNYTTEVHTRFPEFIRAYAGKLSRRRGEEKLKRHL